MVQNLWRQWSRDYLHQLQQRTKWRNIQPNVKIGELVLVKEDNLPPLVWKKAIICDLHPGKDGLTRVVTLKQQQECLSVPLLRFVCYLLLTEVLRLPFCKLYVYSISTVLTSLTT